MKFMPPKPPRFTQGNCEPNKHAYINDGKIMTYSAQKYFDDWYDREIKPLFENAVEVDAWINQSHDGSEFWSSAKRNKSIIANHTALLIGITPIAEESAEDLLREIVATVPRGSMMDWDDWSEKVDKARAYLERKKK